MPTFWKEPFFGPINVDDVAAVDAAIQKMIAWNRYDLIDSLNWFIFDYGRLRRPVISTGPGGGIIPSPGNQVQLCDPFPYSVPQKLSVHRHSAVAFMKGECGHAYTGLIRNIDHELPKLFLFPLDPVIEKDGGHGKTIKEQRGGRDFGLMKAKVYDQEPEPPIVHGGRGSDSTSHAQLAKKVVQKIPWVEKESGDRREEIVEHMKNLGLFIGFTVHKGDFKRRVANRFRMVSAGFNGKAFPVGRNPIETFEHWSREYGKERLGREYPEKKDKPPTYIQVWTDTRATIPESWAFLIQKTVDWLLQFQEALEQKRRPPSPVPLPFAVTLIWLDGDSPGAKDYWKRIRASPGPGTDLPSEEEMNAT